MKTAPLSQAWPLTGSVKLGGNLESINHWPNPFGLPLFTNWVTLRRWRNLSKPQATHVHNGWNIYLQRLLCGLKIMLVNQTIRVWLMWLFCHCFTPSLRVPVMRTVTLQSGHDVCTYFSLEPRGDVWDLLAFILSMSESRPSSLILIPSKLYHFSW